MLYERLYRELCNRSRPTSVSNLLQCLKGSLTLPEFVLFPRAEINLVKVIVIIHIVKLNTVYACVQLQFLIVLWAW